MTSLAFDRLTTVVTLANRDGLGFGGRSNFEGSKFLGVELGVMPVPSAVNGLPIAAEARRLQNFPTRSEAAVVVVASVDAGAGGVVVGGETKMGI